MLQTILLAIVQGIAEFLPISSSGHLVILGALMGELTESPTMEVILHAGTLGSILVVYWRRILNLLSSDRRVIPLLIIGTLPAVVIGLTIKTQFESILRIPMLAGAMLLVTATMLVVLGRLKPKEGEYQQLSYLGALLIGCFQAVAIMPGISRSGSTILGGRLLGLKNEDSVTFSFLLAIPAICGATILTIKDIVEQMNAAEVASGAGALESPMVQQFPMAQLAVGALVSFLVGIVSLLWLIRWSQSNRLHWFAWWCYPAGLAVLALGYFGVFAQ